MQEFLKFIPLDKSWIIRMGFLDAINGRAHIIKFLESQEGLNDDLIALKRVCEDWNLNKPINVGESGTIYRLFKFASWKLGLNKVFVKEGTLKHRNICDDPDIVNLPIDELLKLDNGTSQWASAAVLLGNSEKPKKIPYKLQVTYDAMAHWQEARKQEVFWEAKRDQTIQNQAEAFLRILKGEKADFYPEQAEDYCFARMLGIITPEEGEEKWPALREHESDRITEMEEVMKALMNSEPINSKDHRVVQAAGMWGKINKKTPNIVFPQSVNKSWPKFWQFLELSEGMI